MKRCAYCGTENDDAASVCSQCGSDFRSASRRFTARDLYLDPVSRFRVILIVGFISYLLYVFGPWVLWPNLSRDTQDALSWRGLDAVLIVPPVVYWLAVALWVAATVGVYFFIRAARALYTALLGFAIVTTLLGGAAVGLAVESFLIYLSSLADGAILVLAYWTPLREKFADAAEEVTTDK